VAESDPALAPFAQRIHLRQLQQLILAWEDRLITGETIFFDEFVLE